MDRRGTDDFKPGSLIRKVLAGPTKNNANTTQLISHKGVKLISIIGLYIRFTTKHLKWNKTESKEEKKTTNNLKAGNNSIYSHTQTG